MTDINVQELLKARKESKFDSGMEKAPSGKTRVVEGVEITTKGVDFPEYDMNTRRKKPATKEEARLLKAGGKVSSASKRADGCATKGKTKGRMV